LKGGINKPGWTVDYEYTNPAFEGSLVEGGCNDILVTFTLESEVYVQDDYKIPFKILTSNYSSNILITYEDTGLPLNDTVVFPYGETVKTIRLSAININADVPMVKFNYSIDPCDYPRPPFGNTGYSGNIEFGLINNEAISFTQNPKVYEAYCKETIEITVTDVATGGVDPLIYIWPGNPFPPLEVYLHTVGADPDFVPVTVKDLCGNESSMQVQINNKPVQLDQLPPISFCQPGQTANVEAIVSVPAYPGYTFTVEWTKVYGANTTPLGSGNPFTIIYDEAIGEDQWTCIYKITDICGGEAEGSFIVDQTGKLDLGPDRNICKGQSRLLQTFTPAILYQWYVSGSPGNVLSTLSSVTVTPPITTTYVLRIVDECDLEQYDTIQVIVDLFEPQIAISPSSAEVCPDVPVTFTANDANNWLWIPGNQTTQSITVSETLAGVYTYTLTASSDYCIDKQVSASFEVFPQPSAIFAFNPADDACTGEEIQFTYSDDPTGKLFQWNFGDGATSALPNPVHTYTNDGTFTVSLNVDQYICSDASNMSVVVNPLPTASFNASNTEGCLPVVVQFNNSSQDITPSTTYEWSFGDGITSTTQNPSHEYTNAGNYSVSLKVTNTARCFSSVVQTNLVQVNPNPIAGFEADPWITTLDTPDIAFFNISTSDSTLQYFLWDFGDGTTSTDEEPVHTYLVAGEYEISFRIETINTCWDTVFGKVAVTEEVKLFIPSAFTPNGDGKNDFFEILGTPISNFNLYIFDRWGGQIWSTHNFEKQWDGTTESGEKAPAGTYIYQISGTDYLKRDVSFKGTVTVVR
jgi:gliding motility-associated-like protein